MNGEGSVKDVDFLPKNEELRVQAKQRKENLRVQAKQSKAKKIILSSLIKSQKIPVEQHPLILSIY